MVSSGVSMFFTETSRTGPWTRLWSWRGGQQYPGCALRNEETFSIWSHIAALDFARLYLQSWSKLFQIGIWVDQQSSSIPSPQLLTLHSTQVFAQCVTSSTVSNSFLHIVFDLISIQSENKQTPRFSNPAICPVCLGWSVPPSLQHFIGIVLECNKKGKLNKKEN